MDKEIQSALSELNNNLDNFIKANNKEIESMKGKIMNKNNTLPLSHNLNDDTYQKSVFANYIRNGESTIFHKSLSDKTNTEGGYLIPSEIITKINEKMIMLSPMRSIAKVITISTNSVDVIVDSKKPDAGWATKTNDRPETEAPEIKKIKIPVHEIYAKPKASQHLLDDTQINVEEWLINKISEKIAMLENQAFINGDGTDKPHGFLKYDSDAQSIREFGKLQHFTTGADGKFINDESAINILIDIICSLKPIYIRNAKWIMSRSAISQIRKLRNKDGNNIWQPSLSALTPSTLLGYPVIIDDDMPILKEGSKSTSIAFGDFQSGYQIVDRQGFTILRDPYTSKPFIEFYISKRIGGAVVDFDAIKLLKFEKI